MRVKTGGSLGVSRDQSERAILLHRCGKGVTEKRVERVLERRITVSCRRGRRPAVRMSLRRESSK